MRRASEEYCCTSRWSNFDSVQWDSS